ncbi:unnamed protein product [Penicillium salamii]|nr:unnamed protein product [Penicillium salamii]CAG8378245.1 unnamed protein product [Penicillium salamii]
MTGCFIGMDAPDYPLNLACHPASPYTTLGMLRSFVSGRLSHFFGWTGSSNVIDTACSSAMVAIHHAYRAIQLGDCTRAVAGGINLITNTALFEALQAGGFLSDTGPCKTFDARADGYCRGEAVGVAVLKSLDMALKDGDDIHGVILATASNQNLNYTSLTNSVVESQVALYRETLARAGVDKSDVSYVEAHGTGTQAGDVVEIEAIRQALGGEKRSSSLYIGSTKPNVGHTEGASGVVSLIKVLLMLKHGNIPQLANFMNLNPKIPPLEPDNLAILTSTIRWDDARRLALVNNAGASGNNTFALVAARPQQPPSTELEQITLSTSSWPIFVSALSKTSLLTYLAKLKELIDQEEPADDQISDMAYALAVQQNRQFKHVFSTTVSSVDSLRAQLSDPDKYLSVLGTPKPSVILFSGQNGNTVPYARSFYDGSLLFRNHISRCEEVMQSLGLPGLVQCVLQGIEGDADLVTRHATMFAIQYSCAMSWIESGVKPQMVCGHSLGEWVAMAVSGCITLEAGLTIVTGTIRDNEKVFTANQQTTNTKKGRASLIEKLWGTDTGGMIAIQTNLVKRSSTPEKHLEPFREKYPEAELDIACYNSLNNYVVAGRTSDIELLQSYLKQISIADSELRFTVIRGVHAYHSALVDPILDESAKLSALISFQEPTIPFESCHDGPWSDPRSNIIARNTRGPVQFAQAMAEIINRLGSCVFLEAGIGSTIIPMARRAVIQEQPESSHDFISINGNNSLQSLAEATSRLWKIGCPRVNFWLFDKVQRSKYKPFTLPMYQFDKQKHWMEYTGLSGNSKAKETLQELEPSPVCPNCMNANRDYYVRLDSAKSQDTGHFVFEVNTCSSRYQEVVKGHVVVGFPILPAAMYLALASHAITLLPISESLKDEGRIIAQDLVLNMPLGLDTSQSVWLTLSERSKGDPRGILFQISGSGIANATECKSEDDENLSRISALLEGHDVESSRGMMVYRMVATAVKYSPELRGIRHLAFRGNEGAGDVVIPGDSFPKADLSSNDNIADPLIIDNFFQVAGMVAPFLQDKGTANDECDEVDAHDDSLYVCTGFKSVEPLGGLERSLKYRVYTIANCVGKSESVLDTFVFDEQRKRVWSARGIRFAKVARKSLARTLTGEDPAMNSSEQSSSPSSDLDEPPPVKSSEVKNSDPVPTRSIGINPSKVLDGVQAILSKSLDVPVEEITEPTTLEDLGADSLVSSEILTGICDKFNIQITTTEFASVTDVASVCKLVSSCSQGDPGIEVTGGVMTDIPIKTDETAVSNCHASVFKILSDSLDLDVSEITMDSNLEYLGVDSLVASEIMGNLNKTLGVDRSSTDLSSVVNVASICSLFASPIDVDPAGKDATRRPGAPNASLKPKHTDSGIENTDESDERIDPKPKEPQSTMDSVHAAFNQTQRGFDSYAKEVNLTGFWTQFYPQQSEGVVAFILEAFEKLGCPIRDFNQGDELPDLEQTLPKWHREIPRLWEILEEFGIVEKQTNGFIRGPATLEEKVSAKQLTVNLMSEFPQFESSTKLFDLLGPHLADVLTGKSDSASILFGSDHNRKILEDSYLNMPHLWAVTKVFCDFFSKTIQLYTTDGEPFRILEIGAGTGGTTKHLIPLLQAAGIPFVYTFTEISASLLASAKRTTFKGIEGMEFRKLNIEEDPPEELLEHYHMVVSSNCVHATHDLQRSLTNICRMLRSDDGCLLLIEVTQKLAWYELVWGLLHGWWLFDDGGDYALQSAWAWDRAMQASGFSHVDWSDSTSRESRDSRVILGIAGRISTSCSSKATSTILHRGNLEKDRTLFLFPDVFGSGAVFGGLRPIFRNTQGISVVALNSSFSNVRPDLDQEPSVEEHAGFYVAELKRRQHQGPYILGGYSFGGIVAFEAVRQLLENGDRVEKLFLFDTLCPIGKSSLPDDLIKFLNTIDCVSSDKDDQIQGSNQGRLTMKDHFTFARRQLERYTATKLPGRKFPQAVLVSAREGVNKQDAVPRPCVSPPYQRVVDWFLDDRDTGEDLGWKEFLPDLTVIPAGGSHFSLMESPAINGWGAEIVRIIEA